MANVEGLIRTARAVRFDLRTRKFGLQEEAREREDRADARSGWQPPRSPSPSEEEPYDQPVLHCFAISIGRPDEEDSDFEDYGEREELDDSALEGDMDEEEMLADRRAEWEIADMLQWYSQSEDASASVVDRSRDRNDSVDLLVRSIVEYLALNASVGHILTLGQLDLSAISTSWNQTELNLFVEPNR